MTAWLWIFGWFLAVSAFVPACVFLGMVGTGLYLWVWDRWLDRQEARIGEATIAAEAEEYLRSLP